MRYTLIEVNNKKDERRFLYFPVTLYKNDSCYIRPLDNDVENVFSPLKNKLLTLANSNAIRWILVDEQNDVVGRIAAFINPLTAFSEEQPTGGMGFFDCINNRQAAFILFDACKAWLKKQGMEAMDGPVNLGDRDKWWGVLVDGFTPPSYNMNYNAPYYRELIEAYGFKNYFEQYTYLKSVSWDGMAETLKEKAARIAQNPSYKLSFVSKKALHKAAEDFCHIYNKAWAGHNNASEMTIEHAVDLMKQLKPILDERLIVFAYHENEPIGFYIQIPELNQVVKHLNGKFGLLSKLKFIYLLKVKKVCTRGLGIIFGITPEFRGRGIEAAMVIKFSEAAFSKNFPYVDLEQMWIGDFNPVMMRFQNQIGGKISKTHITYRLLFDENKQQNEFKRSPRIGAQK